MKVLSAESRAPQPNNHYSTRTTTTAPAATTTTRTTTTASTAQQAQTTEVGDGPDDVHKVDPKHRVRVPA
jgi:hypothetical protein